VRQLAPDAVIVATGARPRRPPIEGGEAAHIVDAWQVLRDEVNVGGSVVVADWRCDWVGLGIAEKLARARLPGATLRQWLHAGADHPAICSRQLGRHLHKLGVEVDSLCPAVRAPTAMRSISSTPRVASR